jgi:hypothetical protein
LHIVSGQIEQIQAKFDKSFQIEPASFSKSSAEVSPARFVKALVNLERNSGGRISKRIGALQLRENSWPEIGG